MTNDPHSPSGTAQPPAAADEADAGLGQWFRDLPQRLGLSGRKTLRDTFESALHDDARTGNAFSVEERQMFLRLLRFGARRVEDIMVPRADITAIDESDSVRDLILLFEKAGVSRIPVYHDTLDDPRGMIHIKDLFRWLTAEATGREDGGPETNAANAKIDAARLDLSRPISAAKIRRQVLFVPPSMPAMNLLIKMQTQHIHMALVVDEYGGTDGLLTIEDLVEQVIGDIEDEHDEVEANPITVDAKLGLIATARTSISALEKHLGVKLLKPDEEEDIDTLGGLVFALVGRVPARGEVVRHPAGIEFEVLDADPRRVKKIRIHRPLPEAAGSTNPASEAPG